MELDFHFTAMTVNGNDSRFNSNSIKYGDNESQLYGAMSFILVILILN